MPANLVLIRDGLYQAINQGRKNHSFAVKDIQVRKAYRPIINYEELTIPLVTVIALNLESARNLRSFEVETEFYLQFALQARVNPDRIEDGDKLLLFLEELHNLTKDDGLVTGHEFQWQRTEILRDENGLPYNLNLLREQSTFEAVQTPIYKKIVELE